VSGRQRPKSESPPDPETAGVETHNGRFFFQKPAGKTKTL